MMYSEFNIKPLETYGFPEANLLSRKTKLKTHRRSLLRGKLNALSKKPFEKWHRQSPISVNPCNLSAIALAKVDLCQKIICVPNSQLKDKSVFLTLWTKAIFYDKAGFGSRICREHKADWLSVYSPASVVKNNSCLNVFVAEYLCALCLSRQSLGDGGCPLWLKINQSK